MFRLSAALPLLALIACSGGGDTSGTKPPAPTDKPAPEAAKSGGTRDTLVIGWMADMGNLNPVVSESAEDSELISQLSWGLIDAQFDCSLKKIPAMATAWEWSEDGKTIKMTLRDDIKWEDGQPVTAEDIKFTFDLVADAAVASPRLSSIERLVAPYPVIVDPTHIEWHFTEAYDRDTQMSHITSVSLVPKHVLESADRATLRGNPYSHAPLSYGPFRLASWEPNQRMVLEPNPNFTGPDAYKAHLNRVIFRVLPEYATRLLELEQGNIDMASGILVSDADKLRKERPDIKLYRRGWRSMDYVAWNLSNPLFADVKVRSALAEATDIDDIIAKLLTSETGESFAKRATGTITPALCGVYNDQIPLLPHDVAHAKQLLAEAGWTDTNGDKILDKDGKKFEFTLVTNAGNPRRAAIQVMIQANLKDVGVQVNLEKLESNTFFENLRKKEYEAAVSGWSAALFVDPSTMWHSDTEKSKYEFNFTGYSNPEVDALIEQGLHTPDPAQSAPIWRDMQAKIYADQPYLFLYWLDEIVAVDGRFQNVEVDVLSRLGHLERWEVPEDKVKYKR